MARASAAVLSVAALFGATGTVAAQEDYTDAIVVVDDSDAEVSAAEDVAAEPAAAEDASIYGGAEVLAPSEDDEVFDAAAMMAEEGEEDMMFGTMSVDSTRSHPLPPIAPNPPLPKQCGLSIALVFDLSASLDANEQRQARTAAKSLVSSLQGTDSHVGLFGFATDAEKITVGGRQILDAPIDSPEGVAAVNNAIERVRRNYSNQNFKGGTNWQAGMQEILDAKAKGVTYDVVFFITDGRPTGVNPESAANPPYRFNGPTEWMPGRPANANTDIAGGLDANYTDVLRSVEAANAVKETGARIVPIGVGMPASIELLEDGYGTALQLPEGRYYKYSNWSATRLVGRATAVYDTVSARDTLESISSYDAPLTINNYQELEKALVEAASETCNPSISVRKLIVDPTGKTLSRGEGWTFTPSGPGVVATDSDAKVTPESGIVAWTTEKGRSITFTETLKDGFSIYQRSGKNAECTQNVTDAYGHVTQRAIPVRNTPNGFELTTAAEDDGAISCVIRNYEAPSGTFSVTKRVTGTGKDLPDVAALEYQMQYACWDEGHTPGVDDPDYQGGMPGYRDGVTKQPDAQIPVGSLCWVYENQGDIDRLDVPNVEHSVTYTGTGVRERALTSPINGVRKVAEFTVPAEGEQKVNVEVVNNFEAGTFYVQKFAYEDPEKAVDEGVSNPHVGPEQTINPDGTVNVTYYVRVRNRSSQPGTTGALSDTFKVPAGLVWNGSEKATIEALPGANTPRPADIKNLKNTATEAELAAGLTITPGIENFPGRGEQVFKITIPLKIDQAKNPRGEGTKFDAARDSLAVCDESTWNGKPYTHLRRGVYNVTALVNEDETSTVYPIRDNRACVPVKVTEDWEIAKQARKGTDQWADYGTTGSAVTVGADGTVTADYRIKVTNKSLVGAPNITFLEEFALPKGFTLTKAGLYFTDKDNENPADGEFYNVNLERYGTKDGDVTTGLKMRIADNQDECRNLSRAASDAPVWCRYSWEDDITPAGESFYYHLRIEAHTTPSLSDEDKVRAGECKTDGDGTAGYGLFNNVRLPEYPKDPTEDNDACVPVEFPKWEVSKSSKTAAGFSEPGQAGDAVTPDKDGNVTAIYRIDIHNEGTSAQARPTIEDVPSVPEGFDIVSVKVMDQADAAPAPDVAADGTEVALVDGTLVIQSAEDCGATGYCPTGGDTIDADGHHYIFVAVTAHADPAEHTVWNKLGECEKTGTTFTGSRAFVNKVRIPSFPGEPVEDNETCVPVEHPSWEVKKSAEAAEKGTFAAPGQPGAPVVADENGNFTTLYRIEILNTGKAAGYTPAITDTVSLPDPAFTVESVEIVAGGESLPTEGWKNLNLADGGTFTIGAGATCEDAEGVFCPPNRAVDPEGSVYVYVRVVSRGPVDPSDEAWTKIGVCESASGGGAGKGMHNTVVMPGNPDEPTTDNEVCIPVTKPGWNIQKLPATTDTDTYPEGYGPAGGTGTEVNPAEDGTITVAYRIDLTNTGEQEQARPKFTDTFTLPEGFTATKITMAVSDTGTTPADSAFVAVTPKDGVVTIAESDAECGAAKTSDVFCAGRELAAKTLAPGAVQYYFFRVIAVANDDITEEQWANVGECETTGVGTPGKGFFNFVDLPGENGSREDNDACIPVRPGTGIIDVIKFNQDGTLQLPGAEFTIYHDDNGAPDRSTAMVLAPKRVDGTTVTDDAVKADEARGFKSGKLEFNKVYWLAETRAPYAVDNYELLPEPMKFRLTATGIEVWDGKQFLPAGEDEKNVLGASFRIQNASVSVFDNRLGELPKAGGIGHWTLAAGAGLLIMVSLLMAYRTPVRRRA
ncbi:hypothetical protein C1Y63_02160 [Corynebacterium sp. 13CS0277]|uniref:SpaA isopeptide-forming pilin-related protein n=1 Tax=Corynebacterium sp. 13CS0277 TaxID=2071994 RepID=UPI000D0382B8|nr:VWA domain-containing protein [Corynebacterium sp. 13CS0277]PRQ12138.1 hypothetical protein C1Y63_02160 [Corynebacterium sp. 13CS0277]